MKKKKYPPEFYFELGKAQLNTALKLLFEQKDRGLPKWVEKYLRRKLNFAVRFLGDDCADKVEDGAKVAFYVLDILEMFESKEYWEERSFTSADLDEYIKTREIKSIYNKKSKARC